MIQLIDRGRFTLFVSFLQISFLILFAFFVRYPKLALPENNERLAAISNTTGAPGSDVEDSHSELRAADGGEVPAHASSSLDGALHGENAKAEVAASYPFFQDIHVMMFIGFGFLMTFLKRYGFSSIGLNFLIAALVLQWATLTAGWILHFEEGIIQIDMNSLIGAEFAAAAVLISFGAVLGKVNALQLIFMALVEIVIFQINEYVVFKLCHASDIGDSMVVHAFGAYFGLTVARIIYTSDVHEAQDKETSVYHSDMFAMIGTVFLWLFWPSFNSATALGEGQYRAVINTYFSLAACTVTTFAISALVHKDKFNMVHIQNATLAGGVAVGTMADMIIQPWGALLIGMIAAILSVIGYKYVTPFLSHKLCIHDTCGVNNLHGMPAIMSGIGGIICAALATTELYGNTLTIQFERRDVRTAGQQAAYQAAALSATLIIAIIGGLLTGIILRFPVWNQPRGTEVFDDSSLWILPDEESKNEEGDEEEQNGEEQNIDSIKSVPV